MLVLLFFGLFCAGFSVDFDDEGLRFLSFFDEGEGNGFEVSYEVAGEDFYMLGDLFELDFMYEGKLFENVCVRDLNFDEGVVFTKIVCDVDDLGDGRYVFFAKILREGEVLAEDVNQNFLFGEIVAVLSFEVLDNDYTFVKIDVVGEGENLVVENRIPKDVISFIDENNKAEYIVSDFEYEILESDPLIAWNVEKAPVSINYTIKTKVMKAAEKSFEIGIVESRGFGLLEVFLFASILFFVGLIFWPFFCKDRRSKVKNE